MAKAFKCDICKQYDVGSPYIITIVSPDVTNKVVTIEMCEKCFIEINKAINEQRNGYLPGFEEYL